MLKLNCNRTIKKFMQIKLVSRFNSKLNNNSRKGMKILKQFKSVRNLDQTWI